MGKTLELNSINTVKVKNPETSGNKLTSIRITPCYLITMLYILHFHSLDLILIGFPKSFHKTKWGGGDKIPRTLDYTTKRRHFTWPNTELSPAVLAKVLFFVLGRLHFFGLGCLCFFSQVVFVFQVWSSLFFGFDCLNFLGSVIRFRIQNLTKIHSELSEI